MIEFLQLYGAGFLVVFALWVIFTTFIGNGIGSRFVENANTRNELIVAIFKIFCISWFAGFSFASIGLMIYPFFVQTDFASLFLSILFIIVILMNLVAPISGCFSGIGFIGFVLLIFATQPEKKFYKKLIGSLASAMVGYGFGFSMLFTVFING